MGHAPPPGSDAVSDDLRARALAPRRVALPQPPVGVVASTLTARPHGRPDSVLRFERVLSLLQDLHLVAGHRARSELCDEYRHRADGQAIRVLRLATRTF